MVRARGMSKYKNKTGKPGEKVEIDHNLEEKASINFHYPLLSILTL